MSHGRGYSRKWGDRLGGFCDRPEMKGVMGRGACSRETQEWGRENWAMDVMWGYGDGRSQRWCQVQENTLPSLPSYEFSVSFLWERNKTITYRVAYPHWGYSETTGDLDACWVSCLPGRLLLTAQISWFQQFMLIGVIYFDATLGRGYNMFSTFGAEWLSQVFLIVTLVVGLMLQNYTLVSSKPVTVIISVPL